MTSLDGRPKRGNKAAYANLGIKVLIQTSPVQSSDISLVRLVNTPIYEQQSRMYDEKQQLIHTVGRSKSACENRFWNKLRVIRLGTSVKRLTFHFGLLLVEKINTVSLVVTVS